MTNKDNLNEEKTIKNEEMQKLSEIVVKNKKTSYRIGIIGLLAAIIGFSISIYSIYKLTDENIAVDKQIKVNKIKIDSLNAYKDTLVTQMSRKDSIADLISNFLTEKKSDARLSFYYADTVQNYYLKKRVTLAEIKKERREYSSLNPKSKVTFDKKDISINFKPNGTSVIYVNALYFADSLKIPKEIIYQVKLNKKMKVYYIRNWEPN